MRNRDTSEVINPLDKKEVRIPLNSVREYYAEHYPLLLTLVRTGMRIKEVLALQWGDIDFNSRYIEVRRQYFKGRLSTPKNHRTHKVDMSLQLSETLKDHQLKCKKKGLVLGLGDAPENVFTGRDGQVIDLDNWRKTVFEKALAKSKLRKIKVHDLRQSYATIRISEGHDIVDVLKQFGHHAESFTLKIYNHWMPGKRKSEVDSLDDPGFFVHPTCTLSPLRKKKGQLR